MRLAALSDLRHPMSVDLWVDRVAAHAKVVLVRILGGHDWWRYGCDRLAALSARQGASRWRFCPASAGRSTSASSKPRRCRATSLTGCSPSSAKAVPRTCAALLGSMAALAEGLPRQRPPPSRGQASMCPAKASPMLADAVAAHGPARPVAPILFYRSMLLAADAAPIDAARVRSPRAALRRCRSSSPASRISGFPRLRRARRAGAAAVRRSSPAPPLPAAPSRERRPCSTRLGVPVLQAIVATTRRDVWQANQRGLAPADLAMHVALPELDGRIHAGAIAFKSARPADDALGFGGMANRPSPTASSRSPTASRPSSGCRRRRAPNGGWPC